MPKGRFAILVDNTEQKRRFNKLSQAKSEAIKAGQRNYGRNVILQDTAPTKAGEPTMWEYRGRGVLHAFKFFEPAAAE